jgi:hypothetical protein
MKSKLVEYEISAGPGYRLLLRFAVVAFAISNDKKEP